MATVYSKVVFFGLATNALNVRNNNNNIILSVHKNFSTTDSVPVDIVYRRAVPLFHEPSRAILYNEAARKE